MKISMYANFSTLVDEIGIEGAADAALCGGCNAVEFIDIDTRDSFVPNEKSALEYKHVLDSKGLSVPCYSIGLNLCLPNDDTFDSTDALKRIAHSAKMASLLGSPFLHHTLIRSVSYNPATHVRDFDKVLEKLIPLACEAADICNSLGLTVLYEPQGMYVNGSENFSAFYNEMKRTGKRVGVCGDMGNSLFCDWRPEDFYSKFASEIRHVHAKDYKLADAKDISPKTHAYTSMAGKKIIPTLFGDGDIDVAYCLRTVREAGICKSVSLEGEYGNLKEEMLHDVAVIKRLFEK